MNQPVTPGISLYQQFDTRCKAQGPTMMVDHCCCGVINHIGGLLALGIPAAAVEEFLREALKQGIAATAHVKQPASL